MAGTIGYGCSMRNGMVESVINVLCWTGGSSPGIALHLLLGCGITAVGGCGRHDQSSRSARERRLMESEMDAIVVYRRR